jgi:hypothetical protein
MSPLLEPLSIIAFLYMNYASRTEIDYHLLELLFLPRFEINDFHLRKRSNLASLEFDQRLFDLVEVTFYTYSTHIPSAQNAQDQRARLKSSMIICANKVVPVEKRIEFLWRQTART